MLDFQKKLSSSFYALLSLPATAMGFALSIQIATLSWLMNTKYGFDIHEVGIVWAAGPLAGILGQPIIGLISDKVWFWGGRRRPFIIMGGTLAALMLLALPNIDTIADFLGFSSLIVVASAVALTLDLAINISFNPTRSIIADVTPEGTPRTKGYTWMQTVSGSFGVLAYALGALLGNYFLIYFGVILVLLFSLVPMFFITEKKELSEEEKAEEAKSVQRSTNWPNLWKVYFANAFSWLGVQTMFVYIIVYIKQKIFFVSDFQAKLSVEIDGEIGTIISVSFLILNAVGALFPAFVLEPLTEKIGRVKTQALSVGVMALAYFAIVAIGKTSISLYILMAFAGVGWAAIVSLPFAIMSENVEKGRMGYFMGVFNLSIVLPQLVVSLAIGFVISAIEDKNIIFWISGISLAVSSLLWTLVKESKSVIEDSDLNVGGGHH
ncbi:MAG: MFS transporter [Melioribacteraceae bacterium]|nr:MFS transporter [Melioribacteraceae bacterium]MCF8265574.1 MFS transporter [Melioribacteraceae bacterium]MCF8412312.1 MFS transporter [Melioribacteraceae bacterium]MCF8431621.1 MFS transporter [Melioribacteraceae bacterium]